MSTPLFPVKRRGRPPGSFTANMPTPLDRQYVAMKLPYREALAAAGVGWPGGLTEKLAGAKGYAAMYWDEHRTTLTLLFRADAAPQVKEGGELAWLKAVVGQR